MTALRSHRLRTVPVPMVGDTERLTEGRVEEVEHVLLHRLEDPVLLPTSFQ